MNAMNDKQAIPNGRASALGSYMIRGGLAGRERLRLIASIMQPSTAALLDSAGVGPDARCLDVGCGGGDVALELAARVGPNGSVLGVDLDEEQLAIAHEEARAAKLPVTYRRLDVAHGDLGRGFDVAYARFILTHMTAPDSLCRRLRRAVRPGGVVVVEDIDYRGCFSQPDRVAFRRYCEVFVTTSVVGGRDPFIGARLPGLLRDAGLEDIEVSMIQPIGLAGDGREGDIKRVNAITMEGIVDAAIAEGIASRRDLEDTAMELHRLAADSKTLMSWPRIVQAWGRRPD